MRLICFLSSAELLIENYAVNFECRACKVTRFNASRKSRWNFFHGHPRVRKFGVVNLADRA